MSNVTLPHFQCSGLDEQTESELRAILYGLLMIRQETGFGTLVVDVLPSRIREMKVEQTIKPSNVPGGRTFDP